LTNGVTSHENIKETIKGYLLAGRAVALMQADSVHRSAFHPYISRFKRGAAGIALELYKSEANLEVPVTPVSIYGAEGLLTIGRRLIVRVGEPMTVRPFLNSANPEEDFTEALEKRVADLVRLDVEKYGMPKRKFQKYVRREI
jgi:1-acyl-sn-glycerol-3-phosphate acyltransferase